ncbi:hypothetical protein SEA_VANLEE_133 [Gordonia phage VanLee]|uniref:Lipoprotein n=1 Tax=Gordonia phage VanLee TaxID=2845816 RepID=A0A8F2IF99_9CAUD|nr:hypothetical protein QEH49_gp157 [Gordonia phage VanLee]QWS68249.1 hypothetical protein SEA_VANLEE_133 [Gordonia phage VanLee]
MKLVRTFVVLGVGIVLAGCSAESEPAQEVAGTTASQEATVSEVALGPPIGPGIYQVGSGIETGRYVAESGPNGQVKKCLDAECLDVEIIAVTTADEKTVVIDEKTPYVEVVDMTLRREGAD